MSKLFLTGCSGFIGSRLAQLLCESGQQVVGVDNETDDGDAAIKSRRLEALRKLDGFEYHRASITDAAAMGRILKGDDFSAIINLAALAGVRASMDNPPEFFRNNLIGNVILLEESCKNDVNTYLVASSSSVYGNTQDRPYREDDRIERPNSPYATTKCSTELSSYTHQVLYDMDLSVMRFFTTYGPWGRSSMLMLRLVKWIVEGEPVTVYGDGDSSTRSYTYVDDLVRGIVKVLENAKGYKTFNLSGNERVTVNQAIAAVEKAAGKSADVRYLPPNPADAAHLVGDISKARSELGWEPEVNLEEGIRRTVEWYLENRAWLKDAVPSPQLP